MATTGENIKEKHIEKKGRKCPITSSKTRYYMTNTVF